MTKTFEIYVVFAEASYMVITTNDPEMGMDSAHRLCTGVGLVPLGIAALVKGEHKLAGTVLGLKEFEQKAKNQLDTVAA